MKNTIIGKKAVAFLTAGMLAMSAMPGITLAKTKTTSEESKKVVNEVKTSRHENDNINCVMSNFVDSKEKLNELTPGKSEMEKNVNRTILMNYLLNYTRAKGATEMNVLPTDIVPVCYGKNENGKISFTFGYKMKDSFDKKYIDEFYAGTVKQYDGSNDNEAILLNVTSKTTAYYDKNGKVVYNSPAQKLKDPKKAGVEFIPSTTNSLFNEIINTEKISDTDKEFINDKMNDGLKDMQQKYNGNAEVIKKDLDKKNSENQTKVKTK